MKKVVRLCVFPVIFYFLAIGSLLASDNTSIVGKWKTIDDKTGEPKAIVEVFEKNGKYFGQIKELFIKAGDNPDPICDKCADDDPRKNQPKKGMVIIQDLVKSDNEYTGGTILDTTDGKIWTCKMWIADGKLMVRGSFLFIGRTQTWHKAE